MRIKLVSYLFYMQPIFVHMQLNYVKVRDNLLTRKKNMSTFNSFLSTCSFFKISKCNISMSTCNLFLSTFNLFMLTCNLSMSSCNLFFVCLIISARVIFQLSGGLHHYRWQCCKEVGPQRVKIGPIKWAKLNWSFDKLFSAWKIWYIWWFMEMVKSFEFFVIVSEIPSPKHHEIQEFAKNYHISAIKIKKCLFFNTSTTLLH
jgi:hypothetical protein